MDQPKTQKKEITWKALEYPEYRKHPLWFAGFGLLTALLVLFGLFTGSWTTALVFGLCAVLGIVYASKKPKTIDVKVTGLGVQVDGMEYSYQVIKKFGIAYYPPDVKALYLETSAYLNALVKIELGGQDPNELREFLKKYVEENLEQQEAFTDALARKLKF